MPQGPGIDCEGPVLYVSDMAQRLDPADRAHLVDPADAPYSMARVPVRPELAGLARRFWIPVWDVADPVGSTQRVLQYPVCLLVIANSYARFYGVTSGLGTTTLSGRGWAVGLMLQPAGAILAGEPVSALTDRHVPLGALPSFDGNGLTAAVRATMAPSPSDEAAQARARTLVEDALTPFASVDDEGLLVNAIVDAVEDDPELVRVSQLCEAFGLSERALQRLLLRRVGIGPKWLIRRRRLHEASERLRAGKGTLADLAAELGYADQAHFTKDYRRATGLTPGAFAARFR